MSAIIVPVLETERLIIRPIEEGDAQDIFEYCSDEENTRYMIFPTHKSIEDAKSFIKITRDKYAKGESLDFAFVLKESGKLIGTGGCCKLESFPRLVEIGYIINKKYWGKGYVPEAMSAIVDYLFNVCDVHKIKAIHAFPNLKSGRVMEKLGMKLEGFCKDNGIFNGEIYSTLHYGLVNPNHRGVSKDPLNNIRVKLEPSVETIRELLK